MRSRRKDEKSSRNSGAARYRGEGALILISMERVRGVEDGETTMEEAERSGGRTIEVGRIEKSGRGFWEINRVFLNDTPMWKIPIDVE
jgi:hypothetical protein